MENEEQNILEKIDHSYFWDVDVQKMDTEKSSKLIISRVFERGTPDEMKLVIRYYGKKKTIETLTNLSYIDLKTLNFISVIFDVPKEQFKCYTKKQSTPQHWNY